MRSSFKVISISVVACAALSLLSLRQPRALPTEIKAQLALQADSMQIAIRHMQAVPALPANSRRLQQAFRQVRLAYKRLEWAAEYFDPLTARHVNGPPVPEVEFSGQVIQPDGLQIIEELLFPRFSVPNKAKLAAALLRLAVNAAEFRQFFAKADLQDWQILDAAKQELFRVDILGLNDFDDPSLQNCFRESAAATASLAEVIRQYDPAINFRDAISYLTRPMASDCFDRAAFIREYTNPLTRAITQLQRHLNLPDIRYNRLLNQNASTLFEPGAFNRNAFTAAPGDSATADKIALGKLLFFDPILSGNGKRSCASCHQPEKAFTDGLAKNLDIFGKKAIARNTPTLVNAALQPAQFYDLRAPSLEDQAVDVVRNRDEMHGDMQATTGKLWRDKHYRTLFERAYPQKERAAIDTFEVMNALASFIRSLTALNSRFDSYMQGNGTALSRDEVAGFNLFMGKAKCSTCHYMPLFNGALPPRYMQMEAEVIGVPQRKDGKRIDPDQGMYLLQPFDFNRYAFKVTTVRNTARTAPYMHNGVFNTLEEVVDFYDKGGGVGLGIRLPNQTLPSDRLHLTDKEKQQLIAFIKSLDSR